MTKIEVNNEMLQISSSLDIGQWAVTQVRASFQNSIFYHVTQNSLVYTYNCVWNWGTNSKVLGSDDESQVKPTPVSLEG